MKSSYCIYVYKKCDTGLDNLNIYRFVILRKYLIQWSPHFDFNHKPKYII